MIETYPWLVLGTTVPIMLLLRAKMDQTAVSTQDVTTQDSYFILDLSLLSCCQVKFKTVGDCIVSRKLKF